MDIATLSASTVAAFQPAAAAPEKPNEAGSKQAESIQITNSTAALQAQASIDTGRGLLVQVLA